MRWLFALGVLLSLGAVPDKGGSVYAYNADGEPMMWVRDGVTVQCIGTDSERQMVYGVADCDPNPPQSIDPE